MFLASGRIKKAEVFEGRDLGWGWYSRSVYLKLYGIFSRKWAWELKRGRYLSAEVRSLGSKVCLLSMKSLNAFVMLDLSF